MKIDIITLCDYAQYNNGKLTIVGTLNQINGVSLPARCDMYFVARITFDPDEQLNNDVVLNIVHEGDKKKLVNNHVLVARKGFKPYDNGRRGMLNLVLNLSAFVFPDFGSYVFSLSVGDISAQTYLECNLIKQEEKKKNEL